MQPINVPDPDNQKNYLKKTKYMKIQVVFYPGVKKEDLDSGTISQISWQALHKYLETAFGKKDNERLVGITVTEAGIKAKFETIKQSV